MKAMFQEYGSIIIRLIIFLGFSAIAVGLGVSMKDATWGGFSSTVQNENVVENMDVDPHNPEPAPPFVVKAYTVYLDANGGTVSPNKIEVNSGNRYGTLATPVYANHHFDGWYTEKTGGTLVDNNTVMSPSNPGNKTIYAHWTDMSYTMDLGTIYKYDGTPIKPETIVKQGGKPLKITADYEPTYINNVPLDGQLSIEATATVTGTSNHPELNISKNYTVVRKDYEVKYNLNGGTATITDTVKYYGMPITLSSVKPTKSGYKFNSWNTHIDGSGDTYTPGSSYIKNNAVTLYAIYDANKYSVAYDANRPTGSEIGTGNANVATQTNLLFGQNYTASTNTFRTKGYTFKNWNTTAAGNGTTYNAGAQFSDLTPIDNKTVTLYAQWEENTYNVIYDANGATGGSQANSTRKYNASLTLPTTSTYTKAGYRFDGWYDAKDGGNKVTTIPAKTDGNVTVYAHWKLDTIQYRYKDIIGYQTTQNKINDDSIKADIYYVDTEYVVYEGGKWLSSALDAYTGDGVAKTYAIADSGQTLPISQTVRANKWGLATGEINTGTVSLAHKASTDFSLYTEFTCYTSGCARSAQAYTTAVDFNKNSVTINPYDDAVYYYGILGTGISVQSAGTGWRAALFGNELQEWNSGNSGACGIKGNNGNTSDHSSWCYETRLGNKTNITGEVASVTVTDVDGRTVNLYGSNGNGKIDIYNRKFVQGINSNTINVYYLSIIERVYFINTDQNVTRDNTIATTWVTPIWGEYSEWGTIKIEDLGTLYPSVDWINNLGTEVTVSDSRKVETK